MRKLIVPVLMFLLGVTMALVLYRTAFWERPAALVRVPRFSAAAPPAAEPGTPMEPHAKAAQLLQAGRLREAQDVYLEIVTTDPRDEAALHGLVVVRRYMAGDNPAVLRQQAARYWEAIRRGVATEEHYSPRSMETLLAAILHAVTEIEHGRPAGRAIKPPVAVAPQGPAALPTLPSKPAIQQPPPLPAGKAPPAPAPPAKAARPQTPSASRQQPSAPAPSAKTPAPAAQVPVATILVSPVAPPAAATPPATTLREIERSATAPAPQAPAPPASAPAVEAPAAAVNHLYTIRVGPISDRDLAAALVRQLSAGGFSASLNSRPGFRVLSEPLPRSVAEGLAASLTGRGIHTQIESLGQDTVHLVFGSFSSQKEAEALSQRISAQGYDARVRESTIYTLQMGPYPQPSVSTISGIVKSNAPGAAVTVDPVP